MSKLPPSGTNQAIATNLQIPTATFARPDQPSSNPYPTLSIPPEPFLIDLFCNWIEDPAAILILEWDAGGDVLRSWSIAEFLCDVLDISRRIVLELSEEERGGLRGLEDGKEDDVFIVVVGGGCYAFAVLVLAVYVVGGVVVPLSPRVHPDEAKYFLETCNACLICAVPNTTNQVQSLTKTIPIPIFTYTPQKQDTINVRFRLSDSPAPHPSSKGFALLYTSGTTGPPKGVFHDRGSTTGGFLTRFPKPSILSKGQTYLHHMPVHWAGGFMTLLSGILSGACVEFCTSVFSSTWLLGRLRDESVPPVTSVHLPPPLLNTVAAELADLEKRDAHRYAAVIRGVRKLKMVASGGSTITPKQRVTWQALLGRPLVVGYGMSESFGVVAFTDYAGRGEYPLDSVGICAPNVNMKIDGNGEICIKSPVLFKKYISPIPDLTRNAFDSEGYFRTGDLGKIEDSVVYLLGRASQDVIRYYLWRIYAPEVESALSQIDRVAHAVVLGVKDSTCGERVAAVVVYQQRGEEQSLNLADLRRKLATECGLEVFKLPTLLKVVANLEEIPVSDAGKPIKDRIREAYFNDDAVERGDVEAWTVQINESGVGGKPFDWDGLQR